MATLKTGLTFDELRRANMLRLPEFKNKHGEPAHTKNNGSDWCPAKWIRAVMGELGELAQQRILFEQGKIDFGTYGANVAKELADVQTYLDLLGRRLLDITQNYPFDGSSAQTFMQLICDLGVYANEAKKYDRGDIDANEMQMATDQLMHTLITTVRELRVTATLKGHPADTVVEANLHGVDLGVATVNKFNEVSKRVKSTVRLDHNAGVKLVKV